MGLQKFEQRLEHLVEGVFAKAFRSGLQPVELGRRLVREMDLGRTVAVRGVLAPNRFTIALNPDDRAHLASIEPSMIREFADMARAHAAEEDYRFPGPVEVELVTEEGLARGSFRLNAELVEGGPFANVVLADGRRIGVGDTPVTVGRSSDCEVAVTDPTVSKRHAEFRREGTGIVVVDLGSTNGTRVNGAGVRERALEDGDQIQVGATVLRYEAS